MSFDPQNISKNCMKNYYMHPSWPIRKCSNQDNGCVLELFKQGSFLLGHTVDVARDQFQFGNSVSKGTVSIPFEVETMTK